jgi:hypothetical protein
VERLVGEHVEKAVSKALEDVFSWNGEGRR